MSDYWIRRADVDGERYARVSDVVGYLMHTADSHDEAEAELLRRVAANLSVILTWDDLEPRNDR